MYGGHNAAPRPHRLRSPCCSSTETVGLEPTRRLAGRRSTPLRYRYGTSPQYLTLDSNQELPLCRRGALPLRQSGFSTLGGTRTRSLLFRRQPLARSSCEGQAGRPGLEPGLHLLDRCRLAAIFPTFVVAGTRFELARLSTPQFASSCPVLCIGDAPGGRTISASLRLRIPAKTISHSG